MLNIVYGAFQIYTAAGGVGDSRGGNDQGSGIQRAAGGVCSQGVSFYVFRVMSPDTLSRYSFSAFRFSRLRSDETPSTTISLKEAAYFFGIWISSFLERPLLKVEIRFLVAPRYWIRRVSSFK